jgi:PHD/YefM family antitoxin component YafN of YafNO toxin-antitoxin module
MAAIEIRRNKLAAVVLSEADYQLLANGKAATVVTGMTALQWLLPSESNMACVRRMHCKLLAA